MDGEAPRTLEPPFVARTREGLQEGEAVAGCAVAEAVTLLVAVATGLPGELGPGQQKLLVQVVRGARDHPRRTVAPLQPDHAVAPLEAPPRDRRPGRQPIGDDRFAREDGRRLARQLFAPLTADQKESVDIADEAVHRSEESV